MRIIFVGKVTGVDKAAIATMMQLSYANLVLVFEFLFKFPGQPGSNSHMNR